MVSSGGGSARRNAMRSGVVILGALAFGYLSIQVGFKPFLERASEAMDQRPDSGPNPDRHSEDERWKETPSPPR